MNDQIIIERLNIIEELLKCQSLLQKEVYNLNEACRYLDISASHLYKLTSTKQVPHFCPQGKKLYFKRSELDEWLMRNRKSSTDDIERMSANYILTKRR